MFSKLKSELVNNRNIKIVIGIAISTRLILGILIFFTGFQMIGDDAFLVSESVSYTRVAHNIEQMGEFTTLGKGYPSAFRTPMYPVMLAINYMLFGDSHTVIILLQIIFSVLTALCVFLIARLVVLERIALIAGCGYSFLLSPLIFTYIIGTETTFSFLLVLFVLFCVKLIIEPKRLQWGLLAGVTLGLAVLTRPIAVYLISVPVIILAWRYWPVYKFVFSKSILIIGCYVLVLSPWLIRNHIALGYPGLSTITGSNLWFYYYGSLEAFRTGSERNEIITELMSNDMCEGCGVYVESSFENSKELTRKGLAELIQDPFRFSFLVLRGVAFQLIGYPGQQLKHQLNIPYEGLNVLLPVTNLSTIGFLERSIANIGRKVDVVIVFALQQLPLIILTLAGFIRSWRYPIVRGISIILLVIILYLNILPGVMAFPRFVIPTLPLACVLASFALTGNHHVIEEIKDE